MTTSNGSASGDFENAIHRDLSEGLRRGQQAADTEISGSLTAAGGHLKVSK